MSIEELRAFAQRYNLGARAQEELTRLFEQRADSRQTHLYADAETELGGQLATDWQAEPVSLVSRLPTEEQRSVSTERLMPDGTRYEERGVLGQGGMGEVRRVLDRALGRTMAMKVIAARLIRDEELLARFTEEAQATAQLQHPGIVPVHVRGRLWDGRLYFTMAEVGGRTLREVTAEVHDPRHGDPWRTTPSGWTLRRLLTAFHKVCETMAYAHARGVVHRDLKPDNIMLGEHGTVLVLDWGLAKVVGSQTPLRAETARSVSTVRSEGDTFHTAMGWVAGTPHYMPPEQARGLIELIDARADVYALGAVLYQILSGRPPYLGPTGAAVIDMVKAGPPPALRTLRRPHRLPDELMAACERAMARRPEARFDSAIDLADELLAWLEGARKRERALEIVQTARTSTPRAAAHRAQAERLRAQAAARLSELQTWEAEVKKAPAWRLEDQAQELDRRADLLAVDQVLHLQAALSHDPNLTEAHVELAAVFRRTHSNAEDEGNIPEADRAELSLRSHTEALPKGSPERASHLEYLVGRGALSLVTNPPGARVTLERYELVNRRLVAAPVRALGRTPLVRVPIEMGSYRLRIEATGREPASYPVFIGRQEHWTGRPEGRPAPVPIRLLPEGALGPDEIHVPAGWFLSGLDPGSHEHLPARRVWVEPFVMRRFQVTNREYLAFLNDLLQQGREEDALRHMPRTRHASRGGAGEAVYGRLPSGRFALVEDAEGDLWDSDWPVCLVDWFGAVAYADWLSARTDHPWRLPSEFEWEKGARGVDGRLYPWGDAFDPSWACVAPSHRDGRLLPSVVGDYPVDESPYGVRGMAGNMREWCLDLFSASGPEVKSGRLQIPSAAHPARGRPHRVHRGGGFTNHPRRARLVLRRGPHPRLRYVDVGFRLVRSLL